MKIFGDGDIKIFDATRGIELDQFHPLTQDSAGWVSAVIRAW